MERKICWERGLFDDIELVYEKAEKNENISRLLEQLEEKALEEARYEIVPIENKESAIKLLSQMGLVSFKQDISSSTILVQLSRNIRISLACTIFNILNRLEKLDGAIDNINPKWTLEIQVPRGMTKNLQKWEVLIVKLYPWLNVSEKLM